MTISGSRWGIALSGLLVTGGCAMGQSVMLVSEPVVDVRGKPRTSARPNVHDPLQETQLLYGERVRRVKTLDGWTSIEALEQPEYSHAKRWVGYPGWVPEQSLVPVPEAWAPTIIVTEKWAPTWQDAHLLHPAAHRFPLGTMLKGIDMGGQVWQVELLDGSFVWMRASDARSFKDLSALSVEDRRQLIVRAAEQFLGDPYYWGGRSPHAAAAAPSTVTGVDCSGLVNLAYRIAGLSIPRDAHEQFLRAQPVEALRPADLLFLSERSNPERVVHVMLYAGGDTFIEGPGTGQRVRRIAASQRLGQPLSAVASGTVVDGQTIFFGTYLP